MPVHRVKNSDLETKVTELEDANESIVGFAGGGDGAYVLITSPGKKSRAASKGVEKRAVPTRPDPSLSERTPKR